MTRRCPVCTRDQIKVDAQKSLSGGDSLKAGK